MSVQISPKQNFQAKEDLARRFKAVATSNEMAEAVTAALSEFVICYNPTSEKLQGAKEFCAVLLNLAEKDEPMPKFPQKGLQWIPVPERAKGVKK